MLAELKRRRILRAEDTVVFEKGYCAYDNYAMAAREYRVIPLIFPKKGFDPAKMLRRMHYPLRNHREVQQTYKRVVRTLLQKLERWKEFRPIRSLIKGVFKLAKEMFSLRKLRRYSRRSVLKVVAINVLLVGATIAVGVNEKKQLQRVAEW